MDIKVNFYVPKVFLYWKIKRFQTTISNAFTCSKINNDIYKKYGVGETIEGYPACAEVVVEEGDGDGKDD